MPQVVGGQRPAQAVICEVDPIVETRSVVDRLRVGIRRKECYVAGLSLYANLQRVVIRIRNVRRIGIAIAEGGSKSGTGPEHL